jgi:hypothetical protein
MDSPLTEIELMIWDGSERALRAMLGRERAERIEAQEKVERLERELERLVADLERERQRFAELGAKILREPGFSGGRVLQINAIAVCSEIEPDRLWVHQRLPSSSSDRG